MCKRPVLLKVFVVFFLLVSAFMFSGAEAAFCKDSFQEVPDHQCFTCQSGHDVTTLNKSVLIAPIVPETLFQIEKFRFHPQAPGFDFFRPPLFA